MALQSTSTSQTFCKDNLFTRSGWSTETFASKMTENPGVNTNYTLEDYWISTEFYRSTIKEWIRRVSL